MAKVGLKIEYGAEVELPKNMGTYQSVGDPEHMQIISLYADGNGYAKMHEKLHSQIRQFPTTSTNTIMQLTDPASVRLVVEVAANFLAKLSKKDAEVSNARKITCMTNFYLLFTYLNSSSSYSK